MREISFDPDQGLGTKSLLLSEPGPRLRPLFPGNTYFSRKPAEVRVRYVEICSISCLNLTLLWQIQRNSWLELYQID